MVRAVVDPVHESAYGNAALQQQFGDMPAGLALPATGSGRHENGFCHGHAFLLFSVQIGTQKYRWLKLMVLDSTKVKSLPGCGDFTRRRSKKERGLGGEDEDQGKASR
ncbi:MAG: hypothetical protein ACREDL_20915 [Bradyrhizobium sp.]